MKKIFNNILNFDLFERNYILSRIYVTVIQERSSLLNVSLHEVSEGIWYLAKWTVAEKWRVDELENGTGFEGTSHKELRIWKYLEAMSV